MRIRAPLACLIACCLAYPMIGQTQPKPVTALIAVAQSIPLPDPGGGPAPPHYAIISWTASTTLNVTYNLYRVTGTAPTPCASPSWPLTPLISGITVLAVQDSAVTAGVSYCWTVTAASGSSESVKASPPAGGTVPIP